MRESNQESDEEGLGAMDEELREEIKARRTEPLSPSSSGSVLAGERPPEREFNPFVKAISSQRKDFSYVTQLRKEVIHIVEPFRQKVLTFDGRLLLLEKIMAETQDEIKDGESRTQHKMN